MKALTYIVLALLSIVLNVFIFDLFNFPESVEMVESVIFGFFIGWKFSDSYLNSPDWS